MRCIISAVQTLHFTPRVILRSDSLAGGLSTASILHLIAGPLGSFLCALDSFLVVDMEGSAHINGFVLLLSKCRLPLIVCDVVLDQIKKKVTDQLIAVVLQNVWHGRSADRREHFDHHAAQNRPCWGVHVDFFDRFFARKTPHRDDALVETVDHLVHQQRYIVTSRENPKLHEKHVVLVIVVLGYLFLASFASVEPFDKALERIRLFAIEADNTAARFDNAAVEDMPEVSRVEGEEVSVDVESAAICLRADLDSDCVAVVRGTGILVSDGSPYYGCLCVAVLTQEDFGRV